MKKKRLLIASDCFLPRWDGVARFLDLLIPELAKKFEVTVLVPHFKGELPEYKGVEIKAFPLSKNQYGDINPAKINRKMIKEEVKKTDIVFIQTIGPVGYSTIKYAKKYKKPIVNYVHSVEWELFSRAVKYFKGLVKIVTRIVARRCYNKSSLLLVPSKKVEDILEQNKIKTKKQVVTLGVDTDRFIPPVSKSAAKKKIGINPENKIIGFTGRIAREKDLITLTTSFMQVRKKYQKIKLLIVGAGLTEELPNYKQIIYAGSQNNIVPYLQAMDIYAMPSLTETSSLATMEAMSTGLAVVATPVGMIPEYIINRASGLIFPRGSVDILTEKLLFLLEHDSFRKKIGSNARQTILERYQWKDTVKQIIEIMASLC